MKKDYICISFRKSKLFKIVLKIKQFLFLKRCKKQFKKDLKNDIYFTKLKENNPRSNFNIKKYIMENY